MARQPSLCEQNDWFWNSYKDETDLARWDASKFGNKRIGLALAGIGRIGLHHFRNILREPRAKLLYCLDADRARLDTCAKSMYFKEFGIKALHSDQFDKVLADPEVRAVMIATPTDSHEELARRALAAGKCVMCEKPLSKNSDSIMGLYELARANKVFLLTAFNRRYDPDYRDMYGKVREGAIGGPQMIHIVARDCEPPPLSYVRVSSGLFHDTCIHDLDTLLWYMRQLPSAVQVMGKTWKEFYQGEPDQLAKLPAEERKLLPEVDDYFWAVITLRFPNGSLGVIDNARQASHGYDQRCEIFGSKGVLRCDGLSAANHVQYDAAGLRHSTLTYGFASRFSDAYANKLQDLLAQSKLEASLDCAHEHLLEPMRASLVVATYTVADACQQAAKTSQTIELNWSEAFERQFRLEIER